MDEKLITIRPRFADRPFKNISGIIFQYGVADCSNLEDDEFASVLKYCRRTYGGKATTYGELQNEAGGAAGAIPPVRGPIQPTGQGPATSPGDAGAGDASAEARDSGAASVGNGQERSETAKVKEALELLEDDNDEHWTAEGFPRIDVVAELSGVATITRAEIEVAVPDLVRPER